MPVATEGALAEVVHPAMHGSSPDKATRIASVLTAVRLGALLLRRARVRD